MDPPKILVTFKTKPGDRELIKSELSDLAQIFFIDQLKGKILQDILAKIDVIFTGSGLDLTRDILELAINLRMIQTLSAGVDYLPFKLIPHRVIICSNAGGNAIAVAEHVFALILSAIKRIIYHHENMKKGLWKRRDYGYLLYGKTLGIIGLGHVGREVAKIAKCFGMRVYGINRSGRTDVDVDFIGKVDDLDFVLRESDIILLSLPLTKYTRNLINREKLRIMKNNAILVNISRGGVVDQEALYYHLRDNPSFIACLDVWWEYPQGGETRCYQRFPFHELGNVIMTPHIAGFSREIRQFVIKHAVSNIKRFLTGQKPINIVDPRDYV